MTNGGKRCLDAFARMVVDARDDTLDEVASIADEQARDPVASLVRSRLRAGAITADELREIIESYVDRTLVNLFYAIQDAHLHDGLRLKIACDDGVHDLNEVSDGLAGELMTEEGWFATKSRHGLNAFARSGG